MLTIFSTSSIFIFVLFVCFTRLLCFIIYIYIHIVDENNIKSSKNKMKTTDTICNISSTKLSESEISLLNKGLNFCPSTKEPNKEQLLDDLYFFCRKLNLKEYFHGGDTTTDKIQQEERCDLNAKLPNGYFSPNHETPLNLQRYIAISKKQSLNY